MKGLILAGLMIVSTNVFASKISTIKTLSNSKLNSAATELIAIDLVSHSTLKKVTELKGKGKTLQELRMNTVAQVAHTACPFFDDGVALSLNSKDEKGTLNAVADLIDSSDVNKGDAVYNSLVKNITAINSEDGVEVYSGSASGNNTAGTVVGLYDTKTNEVAVFANTNCGSDD